MEPDFPQVPEPCETSEINSDEYANLLTFEVADNVVGIGAKQNSGIDG